MRSSTDRLIEMLEKIAGVPAGAITADTALAELPFDSLDGVHLLSEVEYAFDIELPDQRMDPEVTVAQFAQRIDALSVKSKA